MYCNNVDDPEITTIPTLSAIGFGAPVDSSDASCDVGSNTISPTLCFTKGNDGIHSPTVMSDVVLWEFKPYVASEETVEYGDRVKISVAHLCCECFSLLADVRTPFEGGAYADVEYLLEGR